jgi:hypothetical protein
LSESSRTYDLLPLRGRARPRQIACKQGSYAFGRSEDASMRRTPSAEAQMQYDENKNAPNSVGALMVLLEAYRL